VIDLQAEGLPVAVTPVIVKNGNRWALL